MTDEITRDDLIRMGVTALTRARLRRKMDSAEAEIVAAKMLDHFAACGVEWSRRGTRLHHTPDFDAGD